MTNLEINAAYIGSTEVTHMYLGNELVWGGEPGPDYSKIPLTFNIISGGTIVWGITSSAHTNFLDYSLDGGETWDTIASTTGGTNISVNAGDVVQFRGNNLIYASGSSYNSYFNTQSDTKFEVEGNIMSLMYKENFVTANTVSSYTFYKLFSGCTGLISAENLVLPATTLANYCYCNMFRNCTSLTTAPSILPATTLANYCYEYMFDGCTSLTGAPALPATTLAQECYQGMFSACTSLTSAPALPAPVLASSCYLSMFRGCTSLTTAPEILATDYGTTNSCRYMFQNCTNLNYIKCMFNQAPPSGTASPTRDWVTGVAASGTFVKNQAVSNWPTGTGGIPTGWTVLDA